MRRLIRFLFPSRPGPRPGQAPAARHRRPDPADRSRRPANRTDRWHGPRQRPLNTTGHYYYSTNALVSLLPSPLSPDRIRDRQFRMTRNGLDATEVHAFLHRVADELAAARAEAARVRDENLRIKRSLRDWQSRFTPRAAA